jgi:hypothetical protein
VFLLQWVIFFMLMLVGLRKQHAGTSLDLRNNSAFAERTYKFTKTSIELAGRRIFRMHVGF